jgi:hypothetical protein
MAKKPEFLHMRWSEADDRQLTEMVKQGKNGTQISKALGRTRSSVYNRKFVLGLDETMKKTPKGMTNALTFGTKVRTKKEEEVVPEINLAELEAELSRVAQKAEPVKEKAEKKTKIEQKGPKVKVETAEKGSTKLKYGFKLAQYNQRRRRGDFAKIAKSTGFSLGYVSAVLGGMQDNERIVSVAYNMVRSRKTNEQMMKK